MNTLQKTLAVQAATMFLCLLSVSNADAEIRTITATGEYRMGDNDTRTDAKRLALLDAKRLALEQAGTYIESITQVKNFDLSKEEIRAYTAGIVEVVEQATKDIMEGSTHIIRVDVTAKIDTDVVTRQIDAVRKNETAKAELLRLRAERDQLKQEIDAKTRELAVLKSKTEVETVTKQRQQALNKWDTYDILEQALWVAQPLYQHPELFEDPQTVSRRAVASDLVREAIRREHSNSTAHSIMCFLLLHGRNFEAAIRECRTAVHLKPDNPMYRFLLGEVLRTMGSFDEAISEFLTAIRLQPDTAMFHSSLGRAYYAKRDLSLAIKEYRAALNLDPNSADTHYFLGVALMNTHDLDQSMSELQMAVRLGPEDADAHLALGLAFERKGMKKAAMQELREFLRLVPDTSENRSVIENARASLLELDR